ncbi:MAG TPA: DUF1272 domain-containing protein [Xanthobacteraceae bacterium]
MLEPNRACCDRDLPAKSSDAMICSFACTVCRAGATDVLRVVVAIAMANWTAARPGGLEALIRLRASGS